MTELNTAFEVVDFLAKAGLGRRIVQLKPKQAFFSQGNPADSVFYLQKGRAQLTVVSKNGKEATIALLSVGEFVGEESIAGAVGLATGDGHRDYRLYSAQDRAGRDDPRACTRSMRSPICS